ncbi:MAG: hypothetical protein U0414_20490 [Polyangiaceae bacterium]
MTIAWPPTVVVAEPTLLAHLVAGLLEEAALLTDSDRRAQLTVILHPSEQNLHDETGAPTWTRAVYDGAVHVVSEPKEDFGVRIESLRHEVMHAAMHAAAVCTPAWFNEGVAMYFSNRVPSAAWRRILRDNETIDLGVLAVPSFVGSEAVKTKLDVDVAYGESLAMVLYAIERGRGIDVIVDSLRAVRPDAARAAASGLWTAIDPHATAQDLRAWLGHRLFGVSSVDELDGISQAAVCCWGSRRISTFGCRMVPAHPNETLWYDESSGRSAVCTNGWL